MKTTTLAIRIDDELSAAESAQCAVFAIGDKELWAIQTQSGTRVFSPRDFWETISAQQKSVANANK
jgi:hypothetical protein